METLTALFQNGTLVETSPVPSHAAYMERCQVRKGMEMVITAAGQYAYIHTTKDGRIGTMVFGREKSSKAFEWYTHKDTDRLKMYITALVERDRITAERDAEYKARMEKEARELRESIKPGDIFTRSWGYDMTIVEFYQIVRVSGSRIYFREIGQEREEGFSGYCTAVKDDFTGPEIIGTITAKGYVKVQGNHVSKWNGTPRYFNTLD